MVCLRPGVTADPSDHAQWSVRLGVDANMREIAAKFSGSELAITGKRNEGRGTERVQADLLAVARVKSKVGTASSSVRSAPREGYI